MSIENAMKSLPDSQSQRAKDEHWRDLVQACSEREICRSVASSPGLAKAALGRSLRYHKVLQCMSMHDKIPIERGASHSGANCDWIRTDLLHHQQ